MVFPLWAALGYKEGGETTELPAAWVLKMWCFTLVALGHTLAFTLALGGAVGKGGPEWEAQPPPKVQVADELVSDELENASTRSLSDVNSGFSGNDTELRTEVATPYVNKEGSGAIKSPPRGPLPVQPIWRRSAAATERHRALLVAVLLGGALLIRGLQLGIKGMWLADVQGAKQSLLDRRQRLEGKKIEVAKVRKELNAELRRTAKTEGVLERRKLDLQEQAEALQADEAALREQERKVQERTAAVVLLEEKAAQVQASLLAKSKGSARSGRGIGCEPDVSEWVEAELAAFVVPACAVSRERGRSALVREYLELVKMRSALAVLTELPAYPSTIEEAKDILRARRMLMGAVVRFQSSVLSTIQTLLEAKGELQAERVIAESRRDGPYKLNRLAEAEWDVKEAENKRASEALEDLGRELEACMNKQAELSDVASQERLTPEEVKKLWLKVFSWKNYEVTLRAKKAQVMHAKVSAFSTKSEFLRQRQRRIQNAKDNEAQRRQRLPNEALRAAEVESMMSAISEELQDMQDFFSVARNVGESYEAPHPDSVPKGSSGEAGPQ